MPARQALLRAAVALAVIFTPSALTAAPSRTAGTGSASRSVAASTSNPFRTGRTLVIPHAGGDGLYPENTVYAYDRSIAVGDVIDADVRMAGDGVLVAFHDATLDRTTNGTGPLRERTWAQLTHLDAAYRFRDGALRGRGIGIPTIESILRRYPRHLVTLDLKDQRVSVVARVCALVRRFNAVERTYVGVDTDEQVIEFRRRCPDVWTSGTSEDRRAMREARERRDATFVPRQLVSQPRYRAADGALRVTAEVLTYAHSRNVAVLTWVVDDPGDQRALVEMGVDGIYTRRPDRLRRLVDEMRGGTRVSPVAAAP